MKEERSYGIIVVFRGKEDRFLILRHIDGHWSFPKGHKEEGETNKETALRELKEETGITKIDLANLPSIFDEYIYERDREKYHKINEFFIGFAKSDEVVIQEEEISEYRWTTSKKVIEMIQYESAKKIFKTIENYLKNHERE